ncbi:MULTISPECIES: glycosyltransferase family 4 protein [unclassified Duganella]|uniref:glycosyltransferase family 4 protein n=1 Tax=unclassified Duganella TaxID=2636909 RepID=UPI00087E5171|nr:MULTISPECIES: glycosyltransferase family 4 protein [unclassified Duganella]SDH36104.1 Glycosyltransferase Family 4 [Duganella sp. OV458]SDK52488.1 Glycosyl transferase 4-like domain-containing protein [Duganella sp. OV510]
MPRLLSINNYHYRRGGSDVVYLEHAALMQEQGWDNAFFSMHHPQNMATPWSEYFVGEIEYGHAYTLTQKLAMASKVVYSREAQRQLTRLLDGYRADVAHLHCIYHHLSPSILSTLEQAGVPMVMTAHDLKIACPAYKMYNQQGVCERCKGGKLSNVLTHRCVRGSLAASAIVMVESSVHRWLNSYQGKLSKVVVPSRFFMEKFVEWGWPRERFAYIPNYVDASRFTPDYRPGDYFLYFGRLVAEKGVATLMRAAVAAGVPLKLVGTGPLDAELRALAAQLGGDISFLGYRAGAALHDLVRGARAVVLPSEWYENAPMTVLESFALGKPVIGAAIGGIPELVTDDATGWTFASGDVAQLAAQLARVASLPAAQLEQIGKTARALVCRDFSRAAYLQAMLALYADLGVR